MRMINKMCGPNWSGGGTKTANNFGEYATAEPPVRFESIGRNRMATIDAGRGPTVTFVHDNPSWSYGFRNQVTRLASSYRVVVPDLLGFGESDGPPGGATFVEQAVALESLLDELALGRVRPVLHDWGGPLGLHWAVKHQDRVLQLVLANPSQ